MIRERLEVAATPPNEQESGNIDNTEVLSNRLHIQLSANEESQIIIRGKYMPEVLRFGAGLTIQSITRPDTSLFAELWSQARLPFNRQRHADGWISLYNQGRAIFQNNIPQKYNIISDLEALFSARKVSYDTFMDDTKKGFKISGIQIIRYDSRTSLRVRKSFDGAWIGSAILRWNGKNSRFSIKFPKQPLLLNDLSGLQKCMQILAIILERKELGVHAANLLHSNSIDAQQGINATLAEIRKIDNILESFSKLYDITFHPDKPNSLPQIF